MAFLLIIMDGIITALKAQQKNHNRINVYIDGEYAFSVERIVGAWLSVGKTLDQGKIELLKNEDILERALQTALRFISYRPRSQQEVEQKLLSKEYAPPVVQKVIERLQTNGLVEDGQFAQTWIENRTEFRPRSRRLLAMELRQKGISDEIIEQSFDDLDSEEKLALNAARKYAHRLNGLEREKFRMRMLGFLARRGFSFEVSRETERTIWLEMNTINIKTT